MDSIGEAECYAAGIVEPHGGKLRVVVPRLSDPPTSHWQIGHALADWFLARDGVPLSERLPKANERRIGCRLLRHEPTEPQKAPRGNGLVFA